MKNQILISGDSWTAGSRSYREMKNKILISGDSWTTVDGVYIQETQLNAWPIWPELIAKKLNMTVKNYGHGGRGNEFIYNQVIDNYDGEELIIVLWSHYDRREFSNYTFLDFTDSNTFFNSFNKTSDVPGATLSAVSKTQFSDEQYNFNKSIRWFHAFQNFCEANKIKYIQAQAFYPTDNIEKWDGLRNFVDSRLLYYINEDHFLGWPIFREIGGFTMEDKLDEVDSDQSKLRVDFPKDPHPNEEGHKYMAELIYKFYKGLYA